MDNLKVSLMNYGRWILAQQLKARADPEDDPDINWARRLLRDASIGGQYSPQRECLHSIFSFVRPHYSEHKTPSCFPRRTLSIKLDKTEDEDPDKIWEDFCRESERLPGGAGDFETFYNLYKKYAWYIPSSLEMDGVSLFEQFKAIAALSHCYKRGEENGDRMLLVGGDVPGIQSMLYTITSKGAAKSLRGRSFYLQLLCDVLVQVILRELSLPTANVIYSAGGNFKLLASAQDVEILADLRREINDRLLDAHRGELSIAISWVELNAKEVMDDCAFTARTRSLMERIGRQRRSWFSEQAKSGRYEDIFGVQERGGPTFGPAVNQPSNYCQICQVDVDEENRCVDTVERDDGTVSVTTKCRQCGSFEELPEMLDKRYFIIENKAHSHRLSEVPKVVHKYEPGSVGKPAWEVVVENLGYRCGLVDKLPTDGQQVSVYTLNHCKFLPDDLTPGWTYGFKFIGKVTPKMSEADMDFMRKKHGEEFREGDVVNTTVMAELRSTGIQRYGVLRMDVDWLGNVFPERLTQRDMLHTSALSAALSLFFEGWLNCICEAVADGWEVEVKGIVGSEEGSKSKEIEKPKLPYIIYSGGDDLFIIGPWDVLPLVAERIRNDFVSFVSKGHVLPEVQAADPCMTISAGISIFHSKFPIYQAASMARDALDNRAKERKLGKEPVKDAVDFLGVTVSWEDFKDVKEMAFQLARMVNTNAYGQKASRSLLTMLKSVASSYQEAAKGASPGDVVYGRWMWQLAYSLSRVKEWVKSQRLREQIMIIGGDALDLGKSKDAARWRMIKYLHLPVRWAEYLTRKGE